MKKIIFTLFAFLSLSATAQNVDQNQGTSNELEREKFMLAMEELSIFNSVDTLVNEGMYMQALEKLDSYTDRFKKVYGHGPAPAYYTEKGNIYMQLEEWQQLVDVTTECLNYNKDNMTDLSSAIIYSMQGSGYRNLQNYKKAILSYEYAATYYSKIERYESQGDMLCSIGICYDWLEKHSIASSYYKKGLEKFFQYFDITKKQLLKRELKLNDSYKILVLRVLGANLHTMSLFEERYGNQQTSKEYLLMAANCGNSRARDEYQRLKGNDDYDFSF